MTARSRHDELRASRYRQRPSEVEAIQFHGTGESCSIVTDFLGGPHATNHGWNPDTLTGGWVQGDWYGEPPMAKRQQWHFKPGCWIVKRSDDVFQVLRDEDFQRIYTADGRSV